MDEAMTLDDYVRISKQVRIKAELTADLARDMARDPEGFNGKFQADRIQKCPICGENTAKSEGKGEPYICPCGWRSDKPNGKIEVSA